MKLPAATALLSAPILAFGNAVLPVGTRELARSPASHLDSRAVCQRDMTPVSDFVQNAFTGKAQLAYSMSGGGIAWSVCTIVNHNAAMEQPCTAYAILVASVVGAIIESQQKASTPQEGATASGRRQAPVAVHQTFADHIAAHGLVWEHIETPTIKRRDNGSSDDVADQFIVRGVVHPDLDVTPADIHYTAFANGTGYVHTIHEPANTGGLQRRHDGAGFKYNWLCEYWDPKSSTGDLHSISIRLGQDISRNWAADADFYALDQWIGAAGIDYILLKLIGVAIRIIPELRGFGEEYEDVNICGDMNQPVRDELK